jgi:hypothetical protein
MSFKLWNITFLPAVLLSLAFWAPCRADTVFLKNGTELDGEVLEDNGTTVVLKQQNGPARSLRRADVETIVYTRKLPSLPGVGTGAAKAGEDAQPKPEEKAAEKKDEAWTAPSGLSAFPKNAKRMDKVKEAAFMAALDQLANPSEEQRQPAKTQIAAMGAPVLPYLAAGACHINVDARTECMNLIGQLNGQSVVKQVVEVFYAAMPESGPAATYQVPFIRAIKMTLPAISGESFNFGEPNKMSVQTALKQYITWYNDNYDRLPPQVSDPQIEPTDPEYTRKLKEARQLKLVKIEWPRPPLPDSETGTHKNNDRPDATSDSLERPADKVFKDTIPKVNLNDLYNKGNSQQ